MDTTMVLQLKRTYDQLGIQTNMKLESIILKPVPSCTESEVTAAVQQLVAYSELYGTTLHTQLAMVKQMTGEEEMSIDALVSELRSMDL